MSDPKKREIYDKYGEDGLKGGEGGFGGPGGVHYEFQYVNCTVTLGTFLLLTIAHLTEENLVGLHA